MITIHISDLVARESKNDGCRDPSLHPCHLLPSCYSHWSRSARDPTTTSYDVESIGEQRCNSGPFGEFHIWRNDVAVETSTMGEQYEDDRTRHSSHSSDDVRVHWLQHDGFSRLEPPMAGPCFVCRSTGSPSFSCSSYRSWNSVSVCPS